MGNKLKKIWGVIKKIIIIIGIVSTIILTIIISIIFGKKSGKNQKLKQLKDKYNEVKNNSATHDDVVDRAKKFKSRRS